MVGIKDIIVSSTTITIETCNGCTLEYDVNAMKCKDELPITPPHKKSLIPSLEEFKTKHIHSIRKTPSELIFNFEQFDSDLHVCHDEKHVEFYSTKYKKEYTSGSKSKKMFINDEPLTPYVMRVYEFQL